MLLFIIEILLLGALILKSPINTLRFWMNNQHPDSFSLLPEFLISLTFNQQRKIEFILQLTFHVMEQEFTARLGHDPTLRLNL